jgi:GntR family histidine utilization transcriptional repressor
MTVNRALRELAAEQVVSRIQGLGTYVAQQKYQSPLVAIRSIADEVRGRGDRHACAVKLLQSVKAPAALARKFEARRGIRLFHSILVHYENETRIQVEDRWVNAALAPDYMGQDFAHSTPNEYLMRVAPLQSVAYRIEAKLPPAEIRRRLAMPAGEPCLVLYRTTRSLGMVASVATMWHPASRYQFTGSF